MRRSLPVDATLLALAGVAVWMDARGYPASLAEGVPAPAFFPRVLALLILACAAWLAARWWRGGRGSAVKERAEGRSERVWAAGLAGAWIAGFLWAWPRVGTLIAVPLLVAGLMWLTGERSRAVLVAVPLAFAAFVQLVFGAVLGAPLPAGLGL